jgi:hypothetical protein
MKKSIFIFAIMAVLSFSANAQNKKDGTPDMRYNSNKKTFGRSYSTPSYSAPKAERNYNNGGQYKLQNGYQKSNGSYVEPHIKTNPDNKIYNNYKPKYK